MNGTLLPAARPTRPPRTSSIAGSAAVVGVIVAALAVVAWRTQRDHPTLVRLAVGSAVLFAIQVVDRWRPGPDPPGRVDADPAPRARRGDLGDAGRADRHELLHGPGERAGGRRGQRRGRGRRRGRTRRPADDGRHDPRLHRADQAADHRAAAGHDGAGDGPRHARPARRHRRRRLARLGRARLLDDDRRDAGGRQRQRDQLLPRSRHRPADDAHPAPAAAGPPGRPGAGGRLRARARRPLVRRDGLLRQPDRGVPDAARDRRSTSSSTRSCSSARRRRTSSSAAPPGRCRRSSAGRR